MVEILSLADELNCPRLRALCMRALADRYGVWQREHAAFLAAHDGDVAASSKRAAAGRHSPESAAVERGRGYPRHQAPSTYFEVARSLSCLSGYDRLSASLRREVEVRLGLPPLLLGSPGDLTGDLTGGSLDSFEHGLVAGDEAGDERCDGALDEATPMDA